MINQEIEQLLAESGAPCVSVIVPVHRTAPDKIKDKKAVINAVKLAKNLLNTKYPEYNSELMLKTIDDMVETLDFVHHKDGIGLFVSPGISKRINFPFPVSEKVKVDKSFESRDLLYYLNTILDYNVLAISQKSINLYVAKGEELHELKNGDFPLVYEETYEYSKPTIGTSYGNSSLKGFERDKSELEEIRLKDLLRKADHLLEKYCTTKTPLVITGGKKEIADFLDVTQFKKKIIGKVTGNFNHDLSQLAKHVWDIVQDYQKDTDKMLLSNLQELFGRGMVAVGIEDVWKQANEGKGLELFLPKDFECAAYISDDGYDLKLLPPSSSNKYTFSVDVIERLITIIGEKRGKVVFLDNGQLDDFDKIALQLRYNTNP